MEKVLESYKLEIRNYKLDESQIIPLVVDVWVGNNRGEAK
jgi:hypothetical protein